MNIITLDAETFYDSKDYTLRKMTTEAYVRDPRFEALGFGVREGERTRWLCGADRPLAFELEHLCDWSKTAVLCHHAHFDGLILSHHYGIRPAFWLDTLSMARLLVGNHLRHGLEQLAQHFQLPAKNVPYNLFNGKHWNEIPAHDQQAIAAGCMHDVDLTWEIFNRLLPAMPKEELALIDQTVRMFTEPCLIGNTEKLGNVWMEEEREKAAALAALDVSGAELRSNESFAALLWEEGIEPGVKLNDKGEEIHAFAKTDTFMRDLQENGTPRVQALVAARLGERSNIIQSRAGRLGWMSTRGSMCVYLSYCAAHTTRFGGGDKTNFQNFPRDSELGEAIEAPPGHVCVVRDASQIECRILNMVAGQHDVVERFKNKEDPYIAIASQFYGFAVTKANEKERGTGKQLELSCGYGAGADTIKATAAKGTYGPPVQITLDDAVRARDLYRRTHPAVTELWSEAGHVLKLLMNGAETTWRGVMGIRDHCIYLPNGAPLIYDTLEWHTPSENELEYALETGKDWQASKGWRLKTRDGWVKMYGAKLVENVVQALARVHTTQAWLRCAAAGIHIVSMEHDKLIAVCREDEAQHVYDCMGVEMARVPDWLPGIPLDSEGFISRTFKKERA